jgi:hypothetical protein
MNAGALWRRLDVPGHDAALLSRTQAGWSLTGAAVFKHADGPAAVDYRVELDATWRTVRGKASGFVGERRFDHRISREPGGWRLDGVLIEGLAHLVDLDFGFTPATNLQQVRRLGLKIGEAAELPVAWFDIGMSALVELPQRYERRDATRYWYVAPSVPYEGMIELAESGFVKHYPGLWAAED